MFQEIDERVSAAGNMSDVDKMELRFLRDQQGQEEADANSWVGQDVSFTFILFLFF